MLDFRDPLPGISVMVSSQRVRSVIVIGSMSLCFAIGTEFFGMWWYLKITAPGEPNPRSGQVIPKWSRRPHPFYVTAAENTTLNWPTPRPDHTPPGL
jgi:hypothetical protein